MPTNKLVPDAAYPGLYRIRFPDGTLSDLLNLKRAKDALDNAVLPRKTPAPKAAETGNSDDALILVVSPAGRGNFVAHLDGCQLCNATRSPFLTAARQLLAEGVDPNTKIKMRHAGSDTDCLTGTIGKAAKLCVLEERGPRFARNRAMIDDEKDVLETCVNVPLHALNDDRGTLGSPDAEKSLGDAKTATRRAQRSRVAA